MRRRINRVGGLLATLVCVVVAALSLVPAAVLHLSAPNSDKWAHFFAYAAVGFSFFLRFLRPEGKNLAPGLGAFLCGLLLGAAIEVIQPFFGRSMELWDLVSDAGGAFLGVAVGETAWFCLKKRKNWTDSELWFKLFSEGSMK